MVLTDEGKIKETLFNSSTRWPALFSFSHSLHGNPQPLVLYYICTELFSALCAGRGEKSFVPEAIVPKVKGMIA
jgi:hypothetical protein